jgi:hypothetical protein
MPIKQEEKKQIRYKVKLLTFKQSAPVFPGSPHWFGLSKE